MMHPLKLYMVLVGCRPKGRYTEQHDVFFGIAHSLKELIPHLHLFWPEAKGKLHIDAWREVTQVNGYSVEVSESPEVMPQNNHHLFFINLGGYKPGEFDEFHYKMLSVATDSARAIAEARQTSFYKTTGFKGATSHVDDKYLLDVDDVHSVKDILHPAFRQYKLKISEKTAQEDKLHLGYLPLSKLTGEN